MRRSGVPIDGVTLAEGSANGSVLLLAEPLSFWGGLDSATGTIIDAHHPQVGMTVSGRVMLMPSGRGSSSSSSVLAEAIRLRTGPVAVLLAQNDPIIALGSLVARQLYGTRVPVVLLDRASYDACASADRIKVDAEGSPAAIYILA